jgi:hypothetical protein
MTRWRNVPPCLLVAARIVQRLTVKQATDDTPIYTYLQEDGKKGIVESSLALRLLRAFIKSEGKPYGLAAADIGLHSLWSSAAMAMYLGSVPVLTIMLLGRWSSDAFLRCIRSPSTALK